MKLWIVFLALSITLIGCMYGNDSYVITTMISEHPFQPTQNDVDIYFEEKPENKKYIQIAHLEAVGKEYEQTSKLLSMLKEKAKSIGADAIIHVKKGKQTREEGDLAIDILSVGSGQSTKTEYEANILSGIAIKYQHEN